MMTLPTIHTSFECTSPQGVSSTTTPAGFYTQSPYTILYFYPKDNTPGCTIEAKEFAELYTEFSNLGIQILGVSQDTHMSHCTFIKDHTLPFPLLTDTDLTLHKACGAWGEKTLYGKKSVGVIRTTVLLDKTGAIIKTRNNVKAGGHAQKVLAFCLKNTNISI